LIINFGKLTVKHIIIASVDFFRVTFCLKSWQWLTSIHKIELARFEPQLQLDMSEPVPGLWWWQWKRWFSYLIK